MTNKFAKAVAAAKDRGHQLVDDSPGLPATITRHTCRICGRAVLGTWGNAYGSATEEPCTPFAPPAEDHS